jgi:dienelactone hydrolase
VTSADSSFARSILGAFARGTGLIAVALAIGIVLLQWSDTSTDAAAGGQIPVVGTPAAPETTTTTTAPAGPRAPAELAVLVLNATGKNNQAKPMAERLAVVGYRTLTPGNAAQRPDSAVLCRPGLDREATALVAATGLPATVQALDAAAAAGMDGAAEADCVVIIGAR